MKTSPKASPSSRAEPWLEELTALDRLTLKASIGIAFMWPCTLSDPPDDTEWTEPLAESGGKKPFGGIG
jgi:hypothetical protein